MPYVPTQAGQTSSTSRPIADCKVASASTAVTAPLLSTSQMHGSQLAAPTAAFRMYRASLAVTVAAVPWSDRRSNPDRGVSPIGSPQTLDGSVVVVEEVVVVETVVEVVVLVVVVEVVATKVVVVTSSVVVVVPPVAVTFEFSKRRR